MDEQRPYVRIVREPDVRRLATVTGALLRECERLQALVGHRPEILARLYASRAVRADDDHGRAAGLVIQADELRWSELEELVRVAESHVDAAGHAGVGTWHPDCPDCEAVLAVTRIRARHRYRTVGPTDEDRPGGPDRSGGRGAARDPPADVWRGSVRSADRGCGPPCAQPAPDTWPRLLMMIRGFGWQRGQLGRVGALAWLSAGVDRRGPGPPTAVTRHGTRHPGHQRSPAASGER